LNRPLIHLVIVALGLLVAGCGPNSNELASSPAESAWSAPPSPPQDTTDGPPALVFVEFVGTPYDVVDRMLKMAQVTQDDVVCDLGCGDGRIVVAAAKRYGCRAIGYDLDSLRVEEARKNAEQQGVSHLVTIEQKNVLSVDLEGVTVVTIYMGTEINASLIPQLSRLKPGARIVSHNFGIGNIPPDKSVKMTSRHDDYTHWIHLWRCPLLRNPR
jgi:SAM-dependent methyltransferase